MFAATRWRSFGNGFRSRATAPRCARRAGNTAACRRGHLAAGEEVPAHPVVVAVDFVRVHQLRRWQKMWTKSLPPGFSQPRSARAASRSCACARTSRPTRNGSNAPSGGSKHVDVRGHHAQFFSPRFRRARLDELALRLRVRHGDDPRVRKALGHPERQRSPAAPSSSMSCPSASSARSAYSSSMRSSAASSVSSPRGKYSSNT